MLPLIPFGAFHHSQSYHPPLSVTLPKRLPPSLAIRPIAFSFFCSAEHTELLPRHYYTPLFERSTSLPSVALVYPISSGRLRLDRDLHFTTVATIRASERGKAKYKEEKQAKVLLTLDKHWTCRFDFPAPPGLHSYSPFSRIISASHSCPTGRLLPLLVLVHQQVTIPSFPASALWISLITRGCASNLVCSRTIYRLHHHRLFSFEDIDHDICHIHTIIFLII